jgi:hypothetical protein
VSRQKFITSPDVHWRMDGRLELDAPLIYVDSKGQVWDVPAGFATDLASVPRLVPGIVRVFFRGELQTAHAAILHDALYHFQDVSRSEADALFYEALRATGETRVGAWLMWAGVRLGGWLPWKRRS